MKRYPGRIFNTPFSRLPSGFGPGHLKPHLFKKIRSTLIVEEEINTTQTTIDGYALLGAALTEMLLLGECKHLICNESSFTFHARVIKKIPTIIIRSASNSPE